MAAAIRPYRPEDAEAIAALTLAAIRITALRAYSPEQVAAWSARFSAARVSDWAAKGSLILVAADAGDRAVAYAVLEQDGHIDMLYCHPEHTGKGLALALLGAAEDAARAQGVTRLFTEASELARPVFLRAGFAVLHRRDFAIRGDNGEVMIHNHAMEKLLG
ncbi:MAG: GNAT family N-acetyltransferase [Erythrobacter sp.]